MQEEDVPQSSGGLPPFNPLKATGSTPEKQAQAKLLLDHHSKMEASPVYAKARAITEDSARTDAGA